MSFMTQKDLLEELQKAVGEVVSELIAVNVGRFSPNTENTCSDQSSKLIRTIHKKLLEALILSKEGLKHYCDEPDVEIVTCDWCGGSGKTKRFLTVEALMKDLDEEDEEVNNEL